MAKIQVFTVLGKNGIIFSEFLKKTMLSLSSGKHEFTFNCFMSSQADPPPGWNGLEYILKQKHTSLNHTTGLNRVLDYAKEEYIIITDADVALLTPNWDTFFINSMERENIDIYGIGHWDHPRGYKNFPVVTFFITKTASYLKASPDLRPNLHEYPNKHGVGARNLKIKTNQDSFLYGVRRGRTVLQDSGWQLPVTFKTANLRGRVLPKTKEYPIQYVPQAWKIDGQLGICHKGKSSKRRQSKAFKFIKSVSAYLKNTYDVDVS